MKPIISALAVLCAGCASTNYHVARFDGAQASPGEVEQAKEICRGKANFQLNTADIPPIWVNAQYDKFYRSCMAERGLKLTEK